MSEVTPSVSFSHIGTSRKNTVAAALHLLHAAASTDKGAADIWAIEKGQRNIVSQIADAIEEALGQEK